METKAHRLEVKVDEAGEFRGYLSTFGNRDLDGDIVQAGAFAKTLMENPRFPGLWQHNTDEPIGVTLDAAEDQHGLALHGKLLIQDVARARETHALMRAGVVNALSMGYRATGKSYAGDTRLLEEVELLEWSAVVFPANPMARVTGVKEATAAGVDRLEEIRRWAVAEGKAGRVLPAADQALVRAAVEALNMLANEAGSEAVSEAGKGTTNPSGLVEYIYGKGTV
jgi:HK97 family phage prohead protease